MKYVAKVVPKNHGYTIEIEADEGIAELSMTLQAVKRAGTTLTISELDSLILSLQAARAAAAPIRRVA